MLNQYGIREMKMLARLLNVSVDQLLDEGDAAKDAVIRERYNLASYGYGCSRVKKDRVIREKYPDAVIYPLLARQDTGNLRMLPDQETECGASSMDRMKQTDKSFYLIEKENRQFVVTVTDDFVETRPLESPFHANRFSMDGWNFIKCNYEIE